MAAAATYIKPNTVLFGAAPIARVERITVSEQGGSSVRFGDNAAWPTRNRQDQRNVRIEIETHDHAAVDSLAVNTTGTLTFNTVNDLTGAVVPKAFYNLIVKPGSAQFGGTPQTGRIVLEVEDPTGLAGPVS